MRGLLKIPITISSDAHHPEDLINQFPETAKLLTEIGFKKIGILLDGKWQDTASYLPTIKFNIFSTKFGIHSLAKF